MTTKAEAAIVIRNLKGIKINSEGRNGLFWYFSPTTAGELRYDNSEKVLSIFLGSQNDNLSLTKIADVYGFPDYLKPYDCREGHCAVFLIYLELGMVLEAFVENKSEHLDSNEIAQIDISPQTTVGKVYFYEPETDQFESFYSHHSGFLAVWKGYGRYP